MKPINHEEIRSCPDCMIFSYCDIPPEGAVVRTIKQGTTIGNYILVADMLLCDKHAAEIEENYVPGNYRNRIADSH